MFGWYVFPSSGPLNKASWWRVCAWVRRSCLRRPQPIQARRKGGRGVRASHHLPSLASACQRTKATATLPSLAQHTATRPSSLCEQRNKVLLSGLVLGYRCGYGPDYASVDALRSAARAGPPPEPPARQMYTAEYLSLSLSLSSRVRPRNLPPPCNRNCATDRLAEMAPTCCSRTTGSAPQVRPMVDSAGEQTCTSLKDPNLRFPRPVPPAQHSRYIFRRGGR